MTKRWLPQWVSEYRDRHGKPRYRFRRKGYAQYLFKHAPGPEGFRREYEACKHGIGAEPIMPGPSAVKPGSFDDLITGYSRSPDFLDPSDDPREAYHGVIDRGRANEGREMVLHSEPQTARGTSRERGGRNGKRA